MILLSLFIINLVYLTTEQSTDLGYCDIASKPSCQPMTDSNDEKLLFYDVNPVEGFNLRRDVYMRFAIMLAEARKRGERLNWKLVLPPWYNLYHWMGETNPIHWNKFFDIDSFRTYCPVIEIYDVFNKTSSKELVLDRLYVLQNYPDPFENGIFTDKWEVNNEEECRYREHFWGYLNISAKEVVCMKFQGKMSKIWEIIALHPSDKKVMIAHGEIPLHDSYGTKTYWDCRKSMKFNDRLDSIAFEYINSELDCVGSIVSMCHTYVAIHWRRHDFLINRPNDIPSIAGTVEQIDAAIKKHVSNVTKVYVATDASHNEFTELTKLLQAYGYKVYYYLPTIHIAEKYQDGGIAIIDQVVCSRAAYFIGTHESTFTFRIQEEREILGCPSKTTFNRFCPDKGPCEKPSVWTVVN